MELSVVEFYCKTAVERGKATFATRRGQLVRLTWSKAAFTMHANIVDDAGEHTMSGLMDTFETRLLQALEG